MPTGPVTRPWGTAMYDDRGELAEVAVLQARWERETAMAVLVESPHLDATWLPKSQVTHRPPARAVVGILRVRGWFAREKGLLDKLEGREGAPLFAPPERPNTERGDPRDSLFVDAWRDLRNQDLVDLGGGAEYQRVLGEWRGAGRPDALPFIRARSNKNLAARAGDRVLEGGVLLSSLFPSFEAPGRQPDLMNDVYGTDDQRLEAWLAATELGVPGKLQKRVAELEADRAASLKSMDDARAETTAQRVRDLEEELGEARAECGRLRLRVGELEPEVVRLRDALRLAQRSRLVGVAPGTVTIVREEAAESLREAGLVEPLFPANPPDAQAIPNTNRCPFVFASSQSQCAKRRDHGDAHSTVEGPWGPVDARARLDARRDEVAAEQPAEKDAAVERFKLLEIDD